MWGARGKSRIKDSAPAYIFAGSTLALAVVLYLAYASFFVLKEVCPLCVATYVAVIGVFVISGGAELGADVQAARARRCATCGVLVATPVALVIALLFVGGAAWAHERLPARGGPPGRRHAAPAAHGQRSERARALVGRAADGRRTSRIANDGAKVLIVEFADFQCPHCRQMYFAYKPILDKYLAEHPKDVKFIFKTWPINSKCNASVPGVNFAASCDASAAYVMAKAKGTAREAEGLVLRAPGRAEPPRRSAASRPTSARSPTSTRSIPRCIEEVKADAAVGSTLGVNSTPAFFVNGKRDSRRRAAAAALRRADRPGAEEGQVMPRNTRNPRTR